MSNQDIDNIMSMVKQQIGGVHTAMPGKVVAFEPVLCRATIKPSINYHTADDRILDYPLITGVPVFMPRAGAAQITYPVKAGDSCLIVFCERSIDEWIGKGSTDNHDPRQFDLTDGFAFVGMCPAQNISADNVEIINNSTLVSVTPDKEVNIIGNVNIKGNVTIDGNYSCSGQSHMQGTITCDGDVTASNTSLHTHTHACPHGGNTGAPN